MKGQSSLIVVLMILVAAAAAAPTVLGQNLTPSQCTEEKNKLTDTCRSVAIIFGRKPSAACCQLIRAFHVECVCPFVTPKLVAALGGAQRAIQLLQSCGRTFPHNFKCGSLTTP